jgi:DNA polymerase elongation subunit (family B)
MICRNLSHDTYVIDKKFMETNQDSNVEFVKVAYDLYEGTGDKKTKTGVKECYYAQYKDGKTKGVIPSILEMLLNERKNTRKKIEYVTIVDKEGNENTGFPDVDNDDYIVLNNIDLGTKTKIYKRDMKTMPKQTYNKFECAVFDALQNAYKVTANSLYGQIGARTSPVYLKDIAACTTSTGREMIMIAKNFVETNYGADVIYGDTDSIFCKFKIYDNDGNRLYGKDALPNAIKIGEDVEMKIKGILPYPQKLNYEKCLYPFILFSKKRYVGNLYEKDVNHFKQKSMGIVLKRRDNANIVKKVFGGVIDYILNKQDIELSVKFLREELRDLVEGRADIKDLILSKTLRGFYKNPTKIAHKVLADRIAVRDAGNKPAVNDRIQYIYIKNPDAKLQGDKIETPEYIQENQLEPDYLHYITNQIMKPILQLYELCLEELNDYKEEPDYWEKVEEDLKKREMYKDDIRRKNRMEGLRLLKVKELLFDEFINQLSEPKIRKSTKKVVEKKVVEINGDEWWNGDIRIVESKVKGCIIYKIVICDNGGKEIWKDEKEEIDKTMTKEKIIKRLLIEVYDKFKDKKIKIKLNYKKFIKEYDILKIKYNEIIKNEDDRYKNDDSMIMKINEIAINRDLIKIIDNIRLVE